MKKKILILVNHDVVIYNFRRELVEKLLAKNFDVIISSPYGPRIDKLIELGCQYKPIDMSRHGTNPFIDIKVILAYFKLIKKTCPDVVLTYTIKPNIYGGIASRFLKTPYIANITGLGTAVENPGILQKITTLLYRFSFKNVKTIFFQNEENMEFFKNRNLFIDRHILLPGSGVNLEYFKPLPYPSPKATEFAFISRIMKEKGIDEYVATARAIKNKYPETRFHICGFCEDNYENEILELDKNGVVKYHGMVDDIRNVLKDIHCTIHPSYYPEGLSNVLLESSASSRPIITTNRSGCREVVDEGLNGFLVDERSPNQLIESVEQFLNLSYEDKKEMGVRGREKVEKEFDREIVIEQYLKEINQIINE